MKPTLLATWLVTAALAVAGEAKPKPPNDTAGLGGRPGRRPIELDPASRPAGKLLKDRRQRLTLGRWNYWCDLNGRPEDDVPWVLHASPVAADAAIYRDSPSFSAERLVDEIPVTRIPDELWKKWLTKDMQDVVGIHFHEFVSRDLARLLITAHRVPADPSLEATATRLEATLMAPVTFHLDQAIVVRMRRGDDEVVQHRVDHERGHAAKSVEAFVSVLGGPQTWAPQRGRGRRSTMHWLWQSKRRSRPWQGYRDDTGTLSTLRTSITLTPPTRWSIMLPTPPDKLTDADMQAFNRQVVELGAVFNETDRAVQEAFHAEHGTFERK